MASSTYMVGLIGISLIFIILGDRDIQSGEATSIPCETLLGRKHCAYGSVNCKRKCSQLVDGFPFTGKCIWSRFGRECYCVHEGCPKPCGLRHSGEHCLRANSLDQLLCRHRCKSMGARTGRCQSEAGSSSPYGCYCDYGPCY